LTFDLFSTIMERMKKKEKTPDAPLLVVDDNPVIVKLLGAMLAQAGYQTVEANSGQQALTLLESFLPDLILLDIDMPGISGLETCRIIKSNPRTADIPIIFVTASGDKDNIVAGFTAGAHDYVIKPSTREELLARVRTHLALCKTQQALRASRARYRELSFIDDLTGLYNTRYLYKTLQAHLEHHAEQALSVVFIDIDHFKRVVDTHGHLNGSRAIAELAAVAKGLLPKGCYGVSYGGDEFVLVLPGHDACKGGQVAEKIRAAIADNRFLVSEGLEVRLTVSCGMASYPEDASDLVNLLGNADHALFETKRRGKNAVVAYAEMKTGLRMDSFLPADPG
jgi:diguanylate cyclase (GGDEF)-like protein